MTIGYSADALIYDPSAGSWYLRPDYDPQIHRVEVTFTDDDNYFHGDVGADEVGSDNNQSAVVSDMSGTPIASGQVYDEEFYAVWDGVTSTIWIERVEIGGVHVGYVVSEPLTYGTKYGESTREDVDGPPTASTYDSFTDVPCFLQGTQITTETGTRPVERIAVGDRVVTRDHDLQDVVWVSHHRVPAALARTTPGVAPIAIAAADGRAPPLFVSPNHRLLVAGGAVELLFGSPEVLVAARHLGPAARHAAPGDFTYHHILCARHEVICANGFWTESLFNGPETCRIATATGLRPPIGLQHRRTARPVLSSWEARLLLRHRTGSGCVPAVQHQAPCPSRKMRVA